MSVLNEREHQILALVAEGFSNREIGWQLHLGEETIKDYVRSILQKLGARNRTHAVTQGMRGGLVK